MKKRLSATTSAVLETTKTKPLLGVVLLFIWLIAAIAPAYSEEGAKSKLFLKSGTVIECDEVWIASKDIVRCKKGSGTILYSIDDVDLKKTFGVSVGEFPITAREEESKGKESVPGREIARKSGFGAKVSYMTYSGDELNLYGVRVDVEADNTLSYGLNYTYLFNDYSSLEFSVDYIRTDVQFAALGLSLNVGEFTQIPALFTFRLHPATTGTVKPYFGAGVGYYFNSFDTNSYNAALIYGAGAEIDVDNSFGFHINGGVDFFIAENYSLNVDLKYVLNKADAEVNIPGFTREEMSMDAVAVGIGLKYYYY